MICHGKTYHKSFYANVPLQCAISGSIEMEHWCKTATVSLKLVLISNKLTHFSSTYSTDFLPKLSDFWVFLLRNNVKLCLCLKFFS